MILGAAADALLRRVLEANMYSTTQYVLNVLSDWSEGFVLVFVFSEQPAESALEAETLSWRTDASVDQVVGDVLDKLDAARPVILDFRSCGRAILQDSARRLNERRAQIERIVHPVLFLCLPEDRMLVQQAAPDLWHIRTMVPEP